MTDFRNREAELGQLCPVDIDLELTDRLRLNVEGQYINSDRTEDGFISAMQTYTDVRIDNPGGTPLVEFLQPGTTGSPAGANEWR